jgi:hypothetical protein
MKLFTIISLRFSSENTYFNNIFNKIIAMNFSLQVITVLNKWHEYSKINIRVFGLKGISAFFKLNNQNCYIFIILGYSYLIF